MLFFQPLPTTTLYHVTHTAAYKIDRHVIDMTVGMAQTLQRPVPETSRVPAKASKERLPLPAQSAHSLPVNKALGFLKTRSYLHFKCKSENNWESLLSSS